MTGSIFLIIGLITLSLLLLNYINSYIVIYRKNIVIVNLILKNENELDSLSAQLSSLTTQIDKIKYVRKRYCLNIHGAKQIVAAIKK